MSATATVLVVDDHATNRLLAQATLEDEGYAVVLAEDGATGIAAFERTRPDCVLLDVQMPGVDGIATCERIRKLPGGAEVAILFVTAQHDVDTFDRALAAGGDDFVTKPYRPSELMARIRTALRLRHIANERDELYELIKQQRDELQRSQLETRDANERLLVATVQADEATEAANALRAAAMMTEQRFRTLVTTSSALVWRATADGTVQVETESWRTFTGSAAAAGEHWLDAVHPADRERVGEAWAHSVATVTPYACEHRIRTRETGYAWVQARAAPIVAPGAELEWIGMLIDISDRVRVEEARERFIGILGHDLRTPLSAILMGVELLGDLARPEADVVARVGRSAHRMEAMIQDVLDFARGRLGGGIPITRRASDLAQICRDVVDELRQAHPTREIELDVMGELSGRWDPERVAQALSNLVSNAIKHGTGAIAVTARAKGSGFVTTVHNHGVPIPASLVSTLFEPFTSSGPAGEARSAQGLGLGLYIASEIVRAHGGTIAVSSTLPDGTTFSIQWPRTIDTASRVTAIDLVPGSSLLEAGLGAER